jgi:hypothetical protein
MVGGKVEGSNVIEAEVIEGRAVAWRSDTETWDWGMKSSIHAGML